MANQVTYGDVSRQAILRGVDSLANAVKVTLGPKGRNVILGTGARQRFPHPRLTAPLARSGIGVEVMSLQAACRTYNILVAEERKVAAALLFR